MYCLIVRNTYLNIYAIYRATYKNDVYDMNIFLAKCLYIYNTYVKQIEDRFSPIFQNILTFHVDEFYLTSKSTH